MKINSPEYIDSVFEFGYYFSVRNNPERTQINHLHFAEQCALKAEARAKKFYEGTSKYMPHQGHKEMNKRLKRTNGL